MVNQNEKNYTKEELDGMRKNTIEFYSSQRELLTLIHEHEKLSCEIDEFRLRRHVAIVKLAQLKAPEPSKSDNSKS